ncbi:MAG: MBL fold metallo-hydrolase [Oscillospiraceae bacterium]|nr:MBL fold metallo-hydrolase [Oscillospiraceae bacterium]
MNITFYGAAHEVTGSLFLVEAAGKKLLIDCGMEQGRDIYENQEMQAHPADIDAVLLTHAHIDHSGKLPLLYAGGFRGPIYATPATRLLCSIMLRDSAHIQEQEAEWRNRKAKRSGGEPYVPLYTVEDAEKTVQLFRTVEYGEKEQIADGVSVRFIDAGHLLGSASVYLDVTENGAAKTILFSGDIGNVEKPILRNPTYPDRADYVVMESTYGDRIHERPADYVSSLTDVIQRTLDRGGNVVIPSFAVGRTQEMLYFIRKIKEQRLVTGHGDFPVYVDSPLAIEATKVFENSAPECFDEEAMQVLRSGVNPLDFPGLHVAVTSDESKAINVDTTPKVIISASGMCEAGRIRHHLKHNLWRPESTILFVGYQSAGTLGRTLLDGEKSVRLFNETIGVRAEIAALPGVSGHADMNGLLRWAGSLEQKPERVFVVHGEDTVTDLFAERLQNELGYAAVAPYNGEQWDLTENARLRGGVTTRIERKAGGTSKPSAAYEKLVAAGRRLAALIEQSRGRANKDLSKFADRLNELCNKWEK